MINILQITFKNKIDYSEIPLFRGSIIHCLEGNGDVLFHNHKEEGLRYAYPLIQYKRINGHAAIVCIGAGVEAIGEFFAACNFDVSLHGRQLHLEVESIRPTQTEIAVCDNSFTYLLQGWLPFNQGNYQQYQLSDSIIERYALMERILVGNILTLAKGLGVTIEKRIQCKIKQSSEPYNVTHKDVKVMAFDVEFICNVSLPDNVGLGKAVSLGFGTVTKRLEINHN